MENQSIPHPSVIFRDCGAVLRFVGAPIKFSGLLFWYKDITKRDLSNESYQYGYQCPEEFLDKSGLFVFLFKENVTYIGLNGFTLVPNQDWEHLCQSFENLTLIEQMHEKTGKPEAVETEPATVQNIVKKTNTDRPSSHPTNLYRSHYSITVANPRRP